MYCVTLGESIVWLYHPSLWNYCGHARCNYCTVWGFFLMHGFLW